MAEDKSSPREYMSVADCVRQWKMPRARINQLCEDGEIMGIRHRDFPIEGVQYHVESILTVSGKQQLANFLKLADQYRKRGVDLC